MHESLKRLIYFIVLSMFLTFMVACNSSSSGEGAETSTGDSATKDSGEKDVLLVGTDAETPPFVYFDKGEIVGFDVDLIKAILDEAGYEYNIENVGWEPLFTSIENGEVDIGISSITITEDRAESFDFGDPYFESKNMIMAHEDTDITAATDLMESKIGVQNGTTGQVAIEKVVGENNPLVQKYETLSIAFMALKNGEIEAVITDNTVANEYVKNNPEDNFIALEDEKNFEPEFYGIMVQKGSDLVTTLNAALATVIENGTYSEIYEEWFGAEPELDVLKALSTTD